MALVVRDRVKETTATAGTGTLTLAGAVAGFQAFSAALSNGDTTYYALFESSTGEWEVGLGTFALGSSTLARTTILASSNAGSAINLTAGSAEVFITQPAGKTVVFDASGDLTLNQGPTANLHAATKQYVDTIASASLHYHDPVRVEEPNPLTVTYNNGTSGVGATLTNAGTQAALVLDGVTMVVADRVLIYVQADATQNGVYTVTNVGSGSTNWVLTRATDADSYGASDPDSLGQGDAFFVREGNTGAGELYVMNTEGAITFGTTAITFAQVSSAAIYSAGDGLTLTGTIFAVGAGTGVTVGANDVSIGQDVSTSADVTFNTVTASLLGNATTATTASGVTANSVALGADTTGNYVAAGAVSGSGLSGSASSEGATFTVTSNATNANTANTIVFRDASGNFSAGTITANLSGNATTATTATTANSVAANSVALGTATTGNYVATVATNAGLDGSGSGEGSAVTLSLNLSELTTSVTDGDGDFFVVVDTANAQRKLTKGNINVSGFNNDAGYTTNVGDITGVTAGSFLTGGGTSGTVTVNVDATSLNTASKVVARDASGNFSAGTITAALTGNASTASTLQTARNIALTGAVTGNANFDGGGNISISTSATSDPTLTLAGDATGSATFTNLGNATLTVTVVDDSHNHIISNVDGLQAALDGKLSTSGKAADSNLLDALDSTQFLRSDVSDTFTSGSLSFSSGTRLTGGLSSPFDGFMMPQNPEGKHIKSPFFFNDIAYARLRGATVSVTVDGTPMTSTTAIDDMLNANGDFWNQTTAGVTTVVITITSIPKPLTYGAYMGITFGNDAWRAKDATLEYSTNNGSTWATAASYADQTDEFLVASFSTGATATNALRWTLQDFNTTSLRVVSLFAYNYNSSGMEGLYVTRDGGDLYANISINGNTVWNAGNDGSGSGLDADLLDGVHGSSFLRSDTADTATGVVTFTDRIDLHEIRTNTGQELILNAGESASYATGQTSEFVYVNAEDGFQVNTSPDNWTSGWAGRVTHTFNASLASFGTTLEIPARIQHTGDTDTYMEFHAADQWRVVTGGVERIEATNSGIRIDDAFTLPTTDGTSGQALVTNGSGTVTWGSAGISTGKAIAMAIVFG